MLLFVGSCTMRSVGRGEEHSRQGMQVTAQQKTDVSEDEAVLYIHIPDNSPYHRPRQVIGSIVCMSCAPSTTFT